MPQATAHNALFAKKLDKLTGKKGQFAGFTEDNVVGAMDAPNGGESDSGVGELQDTEMEVGTITNAGAGWNTYHFREAFEAAPQVTCQAEDFDGVVLVKDITAEGFLYCLRNLADRQLLHRRLDGHQSVAQRDYTGQRHNDHG